MGLQTAVAWHSRRDFSITIFILIIVLILSVSLRPGNWFLTFPFLSLAYSTFYIVGLILSMQIPFVGFQPIRTSEHMAAAGESLPFRAPASAVFWEFEHEYSPGSNEFSISWFKVRLFLTNRQGFFQKFRLNSFISLSTLHRCFPIVQDPSPASKADSSCCTQ